MLAAETVNPVALDTQNMFWGAVLFFTMLVLMYTVCLPPVRKAMRQREELRLLDQEAAERARVEAEQVRRDYDATIAEARAEAGRIVDRARLEAEQRRAGRIAEVEGELAAERQVAVAELDEQRRAALASLTGDVAALAAEAASRVVEKPVDLATSRPIVDEFVASATQN